MYKAEDFILDSCKVTPGFEFYPKKRVKIDISSLVKELQNMNYYIEKDNSPFFVSIKTKDTQVTIFRSLKIIISNIFDENKAKEILDKLINFINKI